MTTTILRRTALVAACLTAFALSAAATTITIVNNDGAGEGFNDPTPVAPVGGNPGTTLGAQRLYIFQYASNIWASTINSGVQIQVNAQFNPLTCTATSATLGSTGAATVHANFANAPFTGTWYVQALANKLAGSDLSASVDMNSTFNSTLDAGSASCLGGETWYYGTDGLASATQVQLLPVVLHETGHGLGFATTTNANTGNYQSSNPSAFDHFLYDDSLGLYWNQETAAQRKASAIAVKNLTWNGAYGVAAAGAFLGPRPAIIVSAPPSLVGSYAVTTGTIGGALTLAGVTGDVVYMQDGTAPAGDGCEALLNGPALAGKIALVDRGVCTFAAKAESAQAYGAIAVLIANNQPGLQPPGGTDPAITIPVVGIFKSDGNAIKAALASGTVTLKLGFDTAHLAGADNAGRPLMYTPNPYVSGSTVSHWDVTLTPNALMEPNINTDLHDNLDITPALLWDIGWLDLPTATRLTMFTAEDRVGGILLTWEFSDAANLGAITVERSTTATGPWAAVGVSSHLENGRTVALDGTATAEVTYYYRLSTMTHTGAIQTYGFVAGRHGGPLTGSTALLAPSPNPAPNGAALTYRLAGPEFVRLAIVDASGRQVRAVQNVMQSAGEHVALWDGRSDAGATVAPGLYFVTLRTSRGVATQRVAVVR